MTAIFLHHYPTSPFGELVRTALGLKGLAWRSVTIPMMMPKPDLVELTGGYARTPVLQIGADLYCDTAAILDALEALHSEPSLYPAPLGAVHKIVAGWAGAAQFAAHVGAAFKNAPADMLPPGFAADRKQRFVGFDFEAMPRFAPHLESQVLGAVAWIDQTLSDGRHYIGGDAPGHGDMALYSNLWFVKSMPFAADFCATAFAAPAVSSWYDRMAAIGHGTFEEASAEDAIEAARVSEPASVGGTVDGFAPHQRVAIRTEQSGDQPVEGELLRCDATGITVARTSERAGTINVHFPRLGQMVTPV
ncbi:MAG: glutathione S-transferase family protein [Sphingomonadaceae bacterium]